MSHTLRLKPSILRLFTLAVVFAFFSTTQANIDLRITKPTVKSISSEEKTVKLKITGMTCIGCTNHVSKTLEEVDGVIEHIFEYPEDVAVVKYDGSKTNTKELIKAIEKAGYKAEIVS